MISCFQITNARISPPPLRHIAEGDARHTLELREKLKELEERKANEFCMAMLNVRQGIKKLEDQLEEVYICICLR
jgi:hypothetical protein